MRNVQSRLAKERRGRRSVVASTAGLASVSHNQPPPDEQLSHAELNRIVSLKEAARLLGVHEDTVRNNYASLIVRVSARRLGLRYRHIIAANPAA